MAIWNAATIYFLFWGGRKLWGAYITPLGPVAEMLNKSQPVSRNLLIIAAQLVGAMLATWTVVGIATATGTANFGSSTFGAASPTLQGGIFYGNQKISIVEPWYIFFQTVVNVLVTFVIWRGVGFSMTPADRAKPTHIFKWLSIFTVVMFIGQKFSAHQVFSVRVFAPAVIASIYGAPVSIWATTGAYMFAQALMMVGAW
jgi:hypothetical protein